MTHKGKLFGIILWCMQSVLHASDINALSDREDYDAYMESVRLQAEEYINQNIVIPPFDPIRHEELVRSIPSISIPAYKPTLNIAGATYEENAKSVNEPMAIGENSDIESLTKIIEAQRLFDMHVKAYEVASRMSPFYPE